MNRRLLFSRKIKTIKSARLPADGRSDDTMFRLLPAVLTIIGLAVGVWQFTSQQAYNDKMEFKRHIWEKRMAAYTEIGDVVAKIVTDRDGSDFDSLYQKFNEMYWGKIPLFEDSTVEEAMNAFKDQLRDKANGVVDIYQKDENKKIGFSGYHLIKTCQKSIGNSWRELNN